MRHSSQAVIDKHSRTSRSSSHIRIQVFSYRIAGHLSLANNSRCCRCFRFWQTSSIKIIAFFAFSPIHGYRYCPLRYIVTVFNKTPLALSASFNRADTFGHSSCCPTDLVTPRCPTVSPIRRHCHQVHIRVISVSRVILSHSRSHLVAVHPPRPPRPPLHPTSRHSIQGSQELTPREGVLP
jgi:hypothetical protein